MKHIICVCHLIVSTGFILHIFGNMSENYDFFSPQNITYVGNEEYYVVKVRCSCRYLASPDEGFSPKTLKQLPIYITPFAPCGSVGPPFGGYLVSCVDVVSDQPTDCTSPTQS
jgi:hypothetical protein